MSKALFVTTVSTGVAFGVEKYPQATPYLKVAAPIICAAGNSTNVSPADVVAALNNSPAANAIATPEGKLILNGALVLYISLFDSYGSDYIKNTPQLQQYLQWTCESIELGLPPAKTTGFAAKDVMRLKQLPPHL